MSPSLRRSKKKMEKVSIEGLPKPPSLVSGFSPPPEVDSDISPPPTSSDEILSRPPLAEKPSMSEEDKALLMYIEDDVTSDILKELAESRFGSFLTTTPPKKPVKIRPETLVIKQFRAAKDAYLSAGDKHLELKFYENASSLFSCAILCVFLSEDAFQAAHLMKDLGGTLPSRIVKSYMFQGVKMLLKAYLLKHPRYLRQAKDWLFKDPHHIYKEDQELIYRAIQITEHVVELVDE